MNKDLNDLKVNKDKVVTRFAPSPTGFMHIGGVRTALFAYLLARKNNGTFILRIEDTDKEREVEGSVEHIKQSLSWLGIEWDFGPDKPGDFGSCLQSERLSVYKKYAEILIKNGHAYPDPYTQDEILNFKQQAESNKMPFLYRNHRPNDELMKLPWDGTKPLRFKTPSIKRYKWHDVVRGDLEAGEEALDDFVLIKSDGYPTYNFAHIVDDFEMGVTHVLRGEEFISSTPKFLSLYEALGFPLPIFATLPPILRDDKTKKLGKRDGAKDILEYKRDGYLSQAMTNILALIGWNPGTEKEIFTMDELIEQFEIEKVQKSGGVFNEDKLDWFNREHIKLLKDDDLVARLKLILQNDPKLVVSDDIIKKTLLLIREKIIRLNDVRGLFDREGELHFVNSISNYPADLLLWKKEPDKANTFKHLNFIKQTLSKIDLMNFTADEIKKTIWSYVEENGKGNVLWPMRVAITGQDKSPDPFVSAYIIGKDETLNRINHALQLIK